MADMVAGDTNRTLRVTCTSGGTVIDITGATVVLRWRITTMGGKPGALQTANMTLTTPASGIASYTFTADQLKPGKMTAEVQITSGGLVLTSDDVLEYDVRPRV